MPGQANDLKSEGFEVRLIQISLTTAYSLLAI